MALGTENRFQENPKDHFIYQKQRPLAPAPMSRSNAMATYKKPTNAYFLGTTLDSNNPAVVRRNARERNRVKQVNNGFTNLRQHIPTAIIADLSNGRRGIGPGASKKLSKVDTLKMAVEYIRRLKRVIDNVDGSDASSVSSFNSLETSSSTSSSPPPMVGNADATQGMDFNCFEQQTPYYAVSYSGLFQQQPNSNEHMISPVDSCNSSYNSAFNSSFGNSQMNSSLQLKFEQPMANYNNTNNQTSSTEDEELLDYISLWQDEL